MVNEFKLAVVHFARPNPMQTCACAWINRWTKKGGKSGPGRRAAGPSRVVGHGPLGLRAFGPPGRRATGPSRAAGLRVKTPHSEQDQFTEFTSPVRSDMMSLYEIIHI